MKTHETKNITMKKPWINVSIKKGRNLRTQKIKVKNTENIGEKTVQNTFWVNNLYFNLQD